MSQNRVGSSRRLLFGGILLFAIVGFAAVSATLVKISLSAVVLVLVAFAEAGLIILGLMMVQNRQPGSLKNQENFVGKSLGEILVRSEEDKET
jgi:hypothetical protein